MQFESLLEKDFLTLYGFDPLVERISAQPVTIHNALPSDKSWRQYTPDFFVVWRTESLRRPWLIEVKPADVLRRDQETWRKKFKACCEYARSIGAVFKVLTEEHIRGPALAQARFLVLYKNVVADTTLTARILHWYELTGLASPDQCFARLNVPDADQPAALSQVWHLVATGKLRLGTETVINRFTQLSFPRTSA